MLQRWARCKEGERLRRPVSRAGQSRGGGDVERTSGALDGAWAAARARPGGQRDQGRSRPPGGLHAPASDGLRVRGAPTGWRLVALIGSSTIRPPLHRHVPARLAAASAGVARQRLRRDQHHPHRVPDRHLCRTASPRPHQRPCRPPASPTCRPGGFVAFSSVACAVAPNIYFSDRFPSGPGGGRGGRHRHRPLNRRDLHSGVALVRFFSTLMLATGLGPVIAPQIGSWVLAVTTWRGMFVVLAVFGLVLLPRRWRRVPETLSQVLPGHGQPLVHPGKDGLGHSRPGVPRICPRLRARV